MNREIPEKATLENLQLMTFKEHARLHMLERKNKIKRGDDDLSIR